jgi:D-alanyl-D-alanine carboxypeptidase/D-alanyl-D-alanine-endopeptidase (penicillin-binding protein 4)
MNRAISIERHSRAGGNPGILKNTRNAGQQKYFDRYAEYLFLLDSRLRGNDGVFLTCTFLLCIFLSSVLNANAIQLPDSVLSELKKANIPASAVAVEVRETGHHYPLIKLNATEAMNPASTMKLLTTYAGLEILGPAYRWKTEAYLDGKLENGVLYGNLVFKGYGDPALTIEAFWLWLRELRQRGLREIRGDIVLDGSFFALTPYDPAAFDNKPTRAYNVGPNALLLNLNALHLRLIPNGHGNDATIDNKTRHARSPHPNPDETTSHSTKPASGQVAGYLPKVEGTNESLRELNITGGQTTALLEPELYGYHLINRITTDTRLPCNGDDAYQSHLEGRNIVLEGRIPATCGEQQDYFSLLPPDDYFFAVFAALWQELGGQIQGHVRTGAAPDALPAFSTHLSPPLSEVIRDINKFSNNTMARQLFLSLGATDTASLAQSIAAISNWLGDRSFPELVLENGAGLSRTERISAHHLADILNRAALSPYSAELEASLPILGMDGTVKRRFKGDEIAGHAHLKTGSLEGVKSLAGYVHARSGKQWIVVFIINHPNAKYAQAAQDALIEWVEKR